VVMRCSSQADMLAAVRAGVGICAMSCIVGDSHEELIRVAPQKLAGISDIWLLAHPDLIDLPPVPRRDQFRYATLPYRSRDSQWRREGVRCVAIETRKINYLIFELPHCLRASIQRKVQLHSTRVHKQRM
jgi:hypothetical protein